MTAGLTRVRSVCIYNLLQELAFSIRHISKIVLSGVEREISSNHVSWRIDSQGRSGEWRERSERVSLSESNGGGWRCLVALALAPVTMERRRCLACL